MNSSVVPHPPRIPAETWEAIFWKLSRPGDLYNVSITSRYINNIVSPILYSRLILDINHYSTYTLCLLKRDPALARCITELTLLPSAGRDISPCLRMESETLYRTLDIPCPPTVRIGRLFTPMGMRESTEVEEEKKCIHPILHFFPSFTGVTILRIVNNRVPIDFFHWIFELPQLTTLEIHGSTIYAQLLKKDNLTPLPIRTLSILRCWTKPDLAESYIPDMICDNLLNHAPLLTSLTVDLFVERAACIVLSEMDHPPPIQTLSCHGLGPRDPNCTLFYAVLLNLPTITTLRMTCTPRELGPALPEHFLPHLRTLTGQIKTLGFFFGAHRPLQYLTIIDGPVVPSGGTPWESQLICLFETLWRHGTALKGLTFHLSAWSEEVFLCVCQLWPGLTELRIPCAAPGVDEYFRISFGPRFLPKLPNLEVLHIYPRVAQHGCALYHSKGVPVVTYSPFTLSPEAEEELAEAPIHYRRWEKACPSLREVAFDRQVWWRRVFSERGGWALMREIIPSVT